MKVKINPFFQFVTILGKKVKVMKMAAKKVKVMKMAAEK